MPSETVVILGATSGIARALCHVMGRRGCRLVLAARNQDEAAKLAADLQIRYGISALVEPFDALDFDGHAAFVERCFASCEGKINGVVLCFGVLPQQQATETDVAEARRTIDANFTSAVSILHLFAARLAQQRQGYIAAISSVAGDRGRQSNYTYGAAKAGLSAFLQGLRNRLQPAGVHVLTIKPGFVDTPMIAGRVDPRSRLVASPERVARDIDRAIRKRRNVLYTPWYWRIIMAIVRSIPESVFKRCRM